MILFRLVAMGKNSRSERKQTTRRNLIKACGAGAVVSFSSMPAIAVEEGSPDDLSRGTHPFITIDITATELTSQQQNRSNPRNLSELSSIVSCIDYRSFGKPNGKQPTDMGPSKTFLTNYRDNRID